VSSVSKKLSYEIGDKSFKICNNDYEYFELNIGCAINSGEQDDVDFGEYEFRCFHMDRSQ